MHQDRDASRQLAIIMYVKEILSDMAQKKMWSSMIFFWKKKMFKIFCVNNIFLAFELISKSVSYVELGKWSERSVVFFSYAQCQRSLNQPTLKVDQGDWWKRTTSGHAPLQRCRNSRSSHYYNELAARRRCAKQTVPTAARITDTLL